MLLDIAGRLLRYFTRAEALLARRYAAIRCAAACLPPRLCAARAPRDALAARVMILHHEMPS